MKIQRKLTIAFLLISFVSLITISIFSYYNSKNSLHQAALNHLSSVASIQQARIESIIRRNLERLGLVASRTQLRISLQKYLEDHKPEHQKKMTRILNDARASIADFISISIYSPAGVIVASTSQEELGNPHFDDDFLARCKKVMTADRFYLDTYNNLRLYLSGPLYMGKDLIGVMVIKSKVDNIINLTSDYSGLGETGETILTYPAKGHETLLITPTRFDHGAALKRKINVNGNSAKDYRGQDVFRVSKQVADVGWQLIVKIDQSEAWAPIIQMRNILLAICLFYALAALFISNILAKTITTPISQLTGVAAEITKGNLAQRARIESGDEISLLATSFNGMANKLITVSTDLEDKIKQINAEITERKKTEEALRLSQERMKLALAGGELGMWDWNIPTGETYFSPRWFSMLGYDSDELPSTYETWMGLIHPEDRKRTTKALKDYMEKFPAAWAIEVRMHHKDGSYRWIIGQGKVVERDEAGKMLRAAGTHQDITDRKAAEEEREQLILKLQVALEEVKSLRGIIPICSSCKQIRDDQGSWNQIEAYISAHSDADFSHGICPDCARKLYPDLDLFDEEE